MSKIKKNTIANTIEAEKLDYKIIMFIIFAVSFSLFNFQVALTRIFSSLFAYHYAFLTISIAIAGTVIGSIISHVFKGSSNRFKLLTGNLPLFLAFMGLSFIFSIVMIFSIPVTLGVFIYVIFIIPVFIFGGIIISVLFEINSLISRKLYFSDLIGAGIGSILSIILLNFIGIISSIMVSVIIIISVAALVYFQKKLVVIFASCLFLSLMIISTGRFINVENNFKAFLSSSDGKAIWRMQKSNFATRLNYTKWNAFSRTDVIEMVDFDDYKIITIDGTGQTKMWKFNGDLNTMEIRKMDATHQVFSMGNSEKVVLIGSGGGSEIIYPLLEGSKNISAVEINTSTIDAVKHYSKYNGNIYTRPEVKVFADDGRYFIHKSGEKFDVIFMSLVVTDIATQSGYMLSEDFIFTKEAFSDYFEHLKDDGRLGIIAHEEKEMFRIITTIIEVLKKKGFSLNEILNRMAVFNVAYSTLYPPDIFLKDIFEPVIIVKNSPISENEAKSLVDNFKSNKERIIYMPYFYENNILGKIKNNENELNNFIKNYEYNLIPVSDDKPYFRIHNKTIPVDLIVLFAVMMILFVIIFIIFGIFKIGTKSGIYFTGIGFAFMMIEVPLISKLTLYLGHPIFGYSCAISILLISSGIGSLLSNRILDNKKLFLPLPAIALFGILLNIFLPVITYNSIELNIFYKIIISFLIILPLGFFMGMPFPYALSNSKKINKNISLPAIWSINGISSVLGSILAVIISIITGYSAVIWAGILLYTAVFIFLNPLKIFKNK